MGVILMSISFIILIYYANRDERLPIHLDLTKFTTNTTGLIFCEKNELTYKHMCPLPRCHTIDYYGRCCASDRNNQYDYRCYYGNYLKIKYYYFIDGHPDMKQRTYVEYIVNSTGYSGYGKKHDINKKQYYCPNNKYNIIDEDEKCIMSPLIIVFLTLCTIISFFGFTILICLQPYYTDNQYQYIVRIREFRAQIH